MAFGKSPEEKAAEKAADDARNAAKQAQEQAAAYAASPVGRAEAARAAGEGFFQLELDITKVGGPASGFGSARATVKKSGGKPDLLGQIEDVGWRLEHVGYVFVETGSTSSNRIGSTGQGVVTRGVVTGIYLFRRA